MEENRPTFDFMEIDDNWGKLKIRNNHTNVVSGLVTKLHLTLLQPH